MDKAMKALCVHLLGGKEPVKKFLKSYLNSKSLSDDIENAEDIPHGGVAPPAAPAAAAPAAPALPPHDVDLPGPDVDLPDPDVDLPGPDVDLPGPDVDLSGPDGGVVYEAPHAEVVHLADIQSEFD
jgi:hypothetical protein